jgi:hypothetical protein
MDKVPYLVVFTHEDGTIAKEFAPERVKEFVVMPSGSIVVRVEEGESFWFNSEGKHPKSFLVFKGE